MQLVGHRSTAIYARYAITTSGPDKADGVAKLAKLHSQEPAGEQQAKPAAENASN
jgi:hypothetical protein